MANSTIYLDNHATTRLDPRVLDAMLPWLTDQYGNAGSTSHAYGDAAREAVDHARASIAAVIGAQPGEIVFTSGATESNNLAIRGVALRRRRRGDHLVSVATEHNAVLDPLRRLERQGYRVTLLGVERHGAPSAGWLDPSRVADALADDTCLASVMMANNEIGVVQPLAEIAAECRRRGVLLHTDATQAVGKLPVDVRSLGVDLMSFTAHKLYGPKGVGALYVRSRDPVVRLDPLVTGGGQEAGRRAGTLNVPGIVGFAAAVELCGAEMSSEAARLSEMRDALAAGLLRGVPGVEICGPSLGGDGPDAPIRLPGNLMVTFGDVDGEAIQLHCPGLAMSSGAACSSADAEPSHVLQAIGLSPDAARCSLRIGLGRFNTAADIEAAIAGIAAAVARLRNRPAA